MNKEEQRNDLEDRIMEIIQSEQQEESQMKKKKKENNVRGIWDKVKHDNLGIIWIPKGQEWEKWLKMYFEEIMAEKF